MPEENQVTADLGTGEIVQETPAVVTEGEQVQTEASHEQMTERERALLHEVQELRDKARRAEEYSRWQAESRQYQQSQTPPQKEEEFDLAPDQIPYVSDVDRLIEKRANAIFEQKMQQMEQKKIEEGIRTISSERSGKDPNFNIRMQMALEVMDRDPYAQALFMWEKDANGKIEALERIAERHPLFGNYKPAEKAPEKAPADDALKKLREQASIPPTLTGIQGSSQAVKQPSQMSDDEAIAYINEIKSRV